MGTVFGSGQARRIARTLCKRAVVKAICMVRQTQVILGRQLNTCEEANIRRKVVADVVDSLSVREMDVIARSNQDGDGN